MPKDIMVTTTVGTIDLMGADFTKYSDKILDEYGVKGVGYDSMIAEETEVYFYGRRIDIERFLREVYGSAEGEEYTYFENEFEADVIFFNFTIVDHYLRDTGWTYSYQENTGDNGERLITRFYDKPGNDGEKIRIYFPKTEDGSPIEFSVITYRNPLDGPLDGKSFEEHTVSAGIDYAESLVEDEELDSSTQQWLNRRAHELNLRPDIDY